MKSVEERCEGEGEEERKKEKEGGNERGVGRRKMND